MSFFSFSDPAVTLLMAFFFKFISGGGFKVLSRRDVIIPGLKSDG